MKPLKHSIAFAVFNQDRTKVLGVLRPADDEDLPNVWGLPAGSLAAEESYEDAVRRAGRDKLGVELQIVKLLNEGEIERDNFILHMKEYEAIIINGKPQAPQAVLGVTQYQTCDWLEPSRLQEAADQGSLCSRLFLAKIKI